MKQQSMTVKVIKNTGLGILFKLLLMLFTFVNRTIFIHTLGEDFLGINGLYTNILSVLALADLGVNTVLMFFLYEPLTNNDHDQLSSLICSFRKIYYGIALGVFAVGAVLIPFLPYIITESPIARTELTLYYVLYLLNSVCSYLAIYKSTLLLADQKAYIVNFVTFIVAIFQNIAYIAVLSLTHNYTLYLLVMITGTLLNNLILTAITNYQYPYVKGWNHAETNPAIRKRIVSSIKSVFVYRVGATVMNSTDNILISMLVSTATVGFYSNYSMITLNLMMLLGYLSQAVKAGIGTLNVTADRKKQELVFRTTQLIYCGIATFCVACLVTMMNDFMLWWIKDSRYVLGQSFVVIIAIKLFVDIITSPNWIFREASGLFKEAKTIMVWAAALNIIFSVFLGKAFGLYGIVLATVISKLCTLFWYEPKVFYRKVFHQPLSRYWRYQCFLLFVSSVSIFICYMFSMLLPHGMTGCVLKICTSGILVGISFLPVLCFTPEGKYMSNLFHNLIKK